MLRVQKSNNLNNSKELDNVSFATVNLHRDGTEIITVIIAMSIFDLCCFKIYVQGWYDQTVVDEEHDVNLKKYEKRTVINGNEYLILIHHQFLILCVVTVSMDCVNVQHTSIMCFFNLIMIVCELSYHSYNT